MVLISEIIVLGLLVVFALIVVKIILEYGGTLFKIALHIISGWVLLTIANFLPGVDVPINILTVLISGFGGVFGTIVLVLLSLLF